MPADSVSTNEEREPSPQHVLHQVHSASAQSDMEGEHFGDNINVYPDTTSFMVGDNMPLDPRTIGLPDSGGVALADIMDYEDSFMLLDLPNEDGKKSLYTLISASKANITTS